jgi:hypothetical protein
MNANLLAMIVYYVLCGLGGFVMADANVTWRNWQFWVLIVCIVGSYLCGYVRGGSI